jgi:diaminopropionate ammonia-lyase
VDDEPIREAMRLAAGSGIVSGKPGAAGLGGLLELLRADEGEEARRTLGVSRETRILAFNSEGATNPDAYRRIVSG